MAVIHKNLTGDEAIHEIMYVQSSDPGAVGANKFWLDTTGGATLDAGAILKQRNGANSGWTTRLDLTGFAGTGAVPLSLIDAKGDLIVGSADNTAVRLPVGTDGHALVADSGQAGGLKWSTAGIGDALTSGKLSQFAATSSSELAGVISDETGSGALVFGTGPTLSNPIVGTQTAGDDSTKAASTAYVDNAVAKQPETLMIAISDETTAITTGTAKVTFRMPFACSMTALPRANLNTASSSGLPAIDINKNGTSIFSTTITIDASELTSVTAATPAVLTSSPTTFADDDEVEIDIDAAGTGAKGLKITMNVVRT